jgi:peptidoglycan/LPS O-acetylase OafA/YrhL
MQRQTALGTSQDDGPARRLSTSEKQRYYRPELDVLRFFAFFMVFLSHVVPGEEAFYGQAHVPPRVADLIIGMSAGGAFGVDLFFALSSFLITTLLFRERTGCGTIDVSSFYVRRMLRIWPLYFAFLLIVSPLLHYILPDENMPLKYILAYALLSGNWACVLWGYPHSVTSPLWSVSIEEQFYLSWPFVMRRWVHHLAIVASALLAVSFITRLCLVVHGAIHPQIWCNTLARLDPIACGALLAVRVERKEIALSPWIRVMLLLFGCALLTAAGHYGDFVGTNALITFPVVTAACIALILGTLGLQIASGRRPIVRALTYLGRISYGLYVFHSMFIAILAVPSQHGLAARSTRAIAALLATIATAAGSYHFFEKPFLRVKEKFARVKSRPA